MRLMAAARSIRERLPEDPNDSAFYLSYENHCSAPSIGTALVGRLARFVSAKQDAEWYFGRNEEKCYQALQMMKESQEYHSVSRVLSCVHDDGRQAREHGSLADVISQMRAASADMLH